MKRCAIYATSTEYLVVCEHQTNIGLYIAGEPMQKVLKNQSATDLGAVVLCALDASRENVPLPTDLKAVTTQLMKFAGVKSWKALARKAVFYGVELSSGDVVITPNCRGEDDGYSPIESQKQKVEATADAVGQGILEALRGCT